MNHIPDQSLGKDTCANCGEVIHMVNAQLGPVWLHADNVSWCRLAAIPASRPWPESVTP